MLRKLSVLWLTLAALLALGIIAPVAAQDTTIRYFTFSAAPDHLKDLDTIIAGFESENPGVKVTVETAAFADYFTLLQSGVAYVGGYQGAPISHLMDVLSDANDILADLGVQHLGALLDAAGYEAHLKTLA